MYFFKQKYKESLPYRLGLKKINIPHLADPVIWVHAVSLGEVKASLPFILEVVKTNPEFSIVFSCGTEAGLNEAKKYSLLVKQVFFLPFDFSWIINPLVKKIKPALVVFVEGDLWPNFLCAIKENEGKSIIINGKISKTSLKRYQFFKSYKNWVFSHIQYVCVQNLTYLERFKQIGIKENELAVTGNMKFELPLKRESHEVLDQLKNSIGFSLEDYIITIGSTHHKEEGLLLSTLSTLLNSYPHLKVCIAPRHAHRFKEVEQMLINKNISYSLWSNKEKGRKQARILLVDTIGMLNLFYQIADVAIVGGSFVNIGGHNILEPIFYEKPTLFGPFMHKQEELAKLCLDEKIGIKTTVDEIPSYIEKLMQNTSLNQTLKSKIKVFFEKNQGSSFQNWNKAKNLLKI